MGSGWGSVGRTVASDAKGPQFESRQQQKFSMKTFSVNCWKDENKDIEAGNGPFLQKKWARMCSALSWWRIASTASMVSTSLTASTASRLFLNVSPDAICTERKAEYFSNKKSPKIEKFGRTETFLFGLLQSLSNKLRTALVSHIRDRSVCITIIIETR